MTSRSDRPAAAATPAAACCAAIEREPLPRLGLSVFWRGYDREAVLRAAELADEMGYDSIWLPEAWGYEVFSLLTQVAQRTKRLKLGTGVVNVFSRTPALLAMSAATLDEISEGRFILGLGTSGPRVVEGLHGLPYVRPLKALRDTIQVVRALLRGERLSRVGVNDRYGPFTLAMTPARRTVPIYCACLQPRAIELAGELGDGWIPMCWPYNRLGEGVASLERGAARTGRSVRQVAVAPFLAVIPCGELFGLEATRRLVALYVGGMGDFYAATLTRLGFGSQVDLVRALWTRGRPREAIAAVPAELIEALTIVGDPAFCRAELARRHRGGVDLAILNLPLGLGTKETEAYIRLLAPTPRADA